MATSEAQSKSLIFQAQELVANQLNLCPALSATPFYPEDMLDIEFQIRDALDRQGIACTVMTPALTYQGRCAYTTAWDFNNLQLVVVENPQINRARDNAMTALDVAYIATDWLCGPTSSTKSQFAPVSIKQGEEGKLVVVTVELKGLLHDTNEEPPMPTQQQVIFKDGMTIRVADIVFLDTFSSYNLCIAIGEDRDDIVEADIFTKDLTYSFTSPFASMGGLKKVFINDSVETIAADEFANIPALEMLYFKGRTMEQVEAMDNYPWGLTDTSVITTEL